jgi:hypothetical protein
MAINDMILCPKCGKAPSMESFHDSLRKVVIFVIVCHGLSYKVEIGWDYLVKSGEKLAAIVQAQFTNALRAEEKPTTFAPTVEVKDAPICLDRPLRKIDLE